MKKSVLFILLFLAACAKQEQAPLQHSAGREIAYYVSASDVAPEFISPPPPPRSTEWNKERDEILKLQKHVSAADKQAMLDEVNLRTELMTEVIGANFTREHLPYTFSLLDKVGSDCNQAVQSAKRFWSTNRPFREDNRIKSLVPPPANGAYPSGHTMCSRVEAEVLGQLMPEFRPSLRARAAEIARHRIQAGVHFPHDVKAGEQLGLIFFGELQQVPKYWLDLSAARREIRPGN